MAVVALSHNLTRTEDFEGTPGGTVGSTGGGPAAAATGGLQYEAAQALSRRIQSTGGHGFDYAHGDIGSVTMYGAGLLVYLFKGWTVLGAVLNAAGQLVGIGDADGSIYAYQTGDDGSMGDDADFAFPVSGGYTFFPIEGRVNAWHSLPREATADLSVQVLVEIIWDVSTTTGAGISCALDSIDYTTDGLFAVGGDSTDADLVFQDFVDADEGAGLSGASSAGLWRSVPAGFQAYLNNVIGRTDGATVTATVMTDSGFSVTFPGGLVSEGRNGLEFDLGNGTTVITLSDGTIKGSDRRFGGRSRITRYFDTELDVSAANDRVTIIGHGFRTGDAVIYSARGGSEDLGAVDEAGGEAEFNTAGVIGTGAYHYVVRFSDDEISFHATPDNAYSASPTNVALTASTAGNGENHSLTRAPDTRPNILFVGTTGSALFTRVALTLTRIITLTSAVELDACVIDRGRQLVLGDGTLTDCIIANPTTSIGEAYLQAIHANDLDLIDGTSFVSGGLGHAIEITTNGTDPQDEAALLNVSFSGYSANDTDNTGGILFDPDDAAGGGDIDLTADTITIATHGFSDGDPVYYSDEGGTVPTSTPATVDQGLYYVNVVDANTISLHLSDSAAIADSNRIDFTNGSTDAEHKLYSANAGLFNNTGTQIDINVTGGGSPTVRNSAGSTTLVVNTVTLTVNVEDRAGDPVASARVSIHEGNDPLALGAELMNELSTAGGVATEAFVFSSDQAITVRIRKSSSADNPRYRPVNTTGTITSDGFTTTVVLDVDPNVE
jgi:hypothetical protein